MRGKQRRRTKAQGRRSYRGMDGFGEYEGVVFTSVLGLSTAVGTILLARHFWNKIAQNTAQTTNIIAGNPSTIATQLYEAMGKEHYYTFSDSTAIFNVLRSIASKSLYAQVQKLYKDNYKTNLNSDLEEKLNADQYNEAIRMITQKPA